MVASKAVHRASPSLSQRAALRTSQMGLWRQVPEARVHTVSQTQLTEFGVRCEYR